MIMKKKQLLLSLLFGLALMMGMWGLSAARVLADGESNTMHDHTGFREWGTGDGEDRYLPGYNDPTKIVLTKDIILTDTWIPRKSVEICLNGHTITMNKESGSAGAYNIIELRNGVTLDLSDCIGTGAIDGKGKYRCIYVENTSLRVDNVQIKNGNGQNGSGGGIFVSDSTGDKSVKLTNLTVTNCTAVGNGGGIHLSLASGDDVKVKNVNINNCIATSAYGEGGGMALRGSAAYLIEDCEFKNNTSKANGGGLAVINTTVTLKGCTITGNTANTNGGGVSVFGMDSNTASLALNNTTITQNSTTSYVQNGGGGGLALLDKATGVLNSGSIQDNTGYYFGGGIYVGPGATAELKGVTVAGNHADGNGVGVYVDYKNGAAGNFKVSDKTTASVTENYDSGNKKDNIRLKDGAVVTVSDALTDGVKFGVSSSGKPTEANPYVVITQGYNNSDPSAHFISDTSQTLVNKENEVALYTHFHTWEYDTTNATATYPKKPSLRVYCTDETCTYHEGVTVKINPGWGSAHSMTVNYEATHTDYWPASVEPTQADSPIYISGVRYYKDGSEEPLAEGDTPHEIGTYQARVNVEIRKQIGHTDESETLTLNYSILPPYASGTVVSRGTLTNTGEPQNLVRATGVKHGKAMYYLTQNENDKPTEADKEKFTDVIPQGATDGTYYIYWYIKGDTGDAAKPYSDTGISKDPLVAIISEEHNHNGQYFAAWSNASTLPDGTNSTDESQFYYLTHDYTLSQRWIIAEGKTVNLCLNGHTITFSGVTDPSAIYVEGSATLNLYDCHEGSIVAGTGAADKVGVKVNAAGHFNMYGGTITGFNGGVELVDSHDYVSATFSLEGGAIESGLTGNGSSGSGVRLENGTTFTMSGGTISGFKTTSDGGGVFVESGGTFNMSDGTITGNTAANGGGVKVNGQATISGGTITDNTASTNGGGVAIREQSGKLTLTGGEITGNKAEGTGYTVGGGGIYVDSNGASLSISGEPTVTGNTSNASNGSANNVFLRANMNIQIASALTGGKVGVTRETSNTNTSQAGVFTSGWNSASNPENYFTADDPEYFVVKEGSEAKLEMHVHTWNVTLSDAKDKATIKCTADNCPYEKDKEYTIAIEAEDVEAPTGNTGYQASIRNELEAVVDTSSLTYYLVADDNKRGDALSRVSSYSIPRDPGKVYWAEATFSLGGTQYTLHKTYALLGGEAAAVVTPKQNLLYTGESQELVNVNFTSQTAYLAHVKAVWINTNNEGWQQSTYYDAWSYIPEGTEAGTYEIKYWVEAEPGYKNKGSQENPFTLEVTILPAISVYHLYQDVNGGWEFPTEKTEVDDTITASTYSVPASTDTACQATGYSFDKPTAEPTAIPSGKAIDLSSASEKLFIYYSRNERSLNFYGLKVDGQPTDKPVWSETVFQGASLQGFSNETLPMEGKRFAGWTESNTQKGDYAETQLFNWSTTVGDQDIELYPMYWNSISQTVTFKVVNGSWNDGEGDAATADRTVTLTGYEGDTLKLTADQIPAVGNKPNDTYKAGSWDVTPSPDVEIAGNPIYTYTYATKNSISRTVTFKVMNGSWNDGTDTDKIVTLYGLENDTLKLAENQIPAVGSKPGTNFKAGSWDTEPSADIAITEGATYTYTYAQKEQISCTVTFKVVNGSWNEGAGDAARADKTVTLTGLEDDTLKLASNQIPAVGGKPDDTYKAGSWDVTPSPYGEIGGNTIYTYTYVAKDSISRAVTFKVVNGSWNDGTDTDKIVTLYGLENDKLKLSQNQIPAVGGKPGTTYKAGNWDETPSTDIEIIEAKTYTYTYAAKVPQTITAENMSATYGDSGKSVSANVTDPKTGGGEISYAVKSGSEDYIEVNASSGALTIKKAGKATVVVTAAETEACVKATKEVMVTISKADPTANAPMATATYGQTLADVTLPNPEGNTAGTWTFVDAGTTSVGNVGNNTFKATFTPEDTVNYNSKENVDVTVTVGKADNPATVTNTATVIKGGNNVNLAENVKLNGAKGVVSYAISGQANGCTLKDSVLTSGNNTGSVIVNVTVAEDNNYNALRATPITVTIIDKGTQTITAHNVIATYGDTNKAINATTEGTGAISYAVKGDSTDYIDVDANSGTLTIKKAGTATVIVTVAETTAYAQAAKEVTVTINKANSVAAAVTSSNITYDGMEKPLVTVDESTLVGGTMQYALGTDATAAPDESAYTSSIPTGTDAGNYYVWYKVAGDDNHNDTTPECVPVTIVENSEENSEDITPETQSTTTESQSPAAEEQEAPTSQKDQQTANTSYILNLKATQTGSKITLTWNRISGASLYKLYGSECGPKKKYFKTIKGNKTTKLTIVKLNGKKLDLKKIYKFQIIAYKKVNGKTKQIARSLDVHVAGRKNALYTNAKAVKVTKKTYRLKKGKTAKISVKITTAVKKKKLIKTSHGRRLRYVSTNKAIATVSSSGLIKARKPGKCSIYVYAINGVNQKITIVVKK